MILFTLKREVGIDYVQSLVKVLKKAIKSWSLLPNQKSLLMSLAMNEKFKFKDTILVEDIFKMLCEGMNINILTTPYYYAVRINPNVKVEGNISLDTVVRFISYGDLKTRPYPKLLELVHTINKQKF